MHNGQLWAVVYDGDTQDILSKTFENWLDPGYLEEFFNRNIKDLESYFHITNLDSAIYDTIEDAVSLSCLMHTLNELRKMEMVRNYLLDNGIVDAEGISEELL